MRSPSRSALRVLQFRLIRLLFGSELRQLLVSRSLWTLLLILAPLVGFSFIQAVYVFSEVSKSAERVPALAHSLSPLDGIEGPTFGALYLANTFLLPFVAIRLIGNDKQSGGIKLLLQLPVGPTRLVVLKLAALLVGWMLALAVSLSAMAVWLLLGGHMYLPELLSVVVGHALYALVIAGVAFLAAAVTESSATAAIVALAFTLGGWVLDFAGGTQVGVVRTLATYSPATSLRTLERGLLGSPQILALLVPAMALLALAAVWLHSGVTRVRKALSSVVVLAIAGLVVLFGTNWQAYADLSEDRRNSFYPSEEQALRTLDQQLDITVNLSPSDSRLKDLDRNVISKLRRVVPHVSVTYADTGAATVFGGGTDDRYGVTTLDYAGRHAETRATTAREVLGAIYRLGNLQVQPEPASAFYRGYPLVADARATGWWFYGGLPVLCALGWWLSRQPSARARRRPTGPGRRPKWLHVPRRRNVVVSLVVIGLGMQILPYGHDVANAGRATEAGPATTCAVGRAEGDEPITTIKELKAKVDELSGLVNLSFPALLAFKLTVFAYVGQVQAGYDHIRVELARLYPRRCMALDVARTQAQFALFQKKPPDIGATRLALAALRASFEQISHDLDARIGRDGENAALAAQPPEEAAPRVSGEPLWDSDATRAVALRACAACHSNEARLPWYTRIAPLSWIAEQNISAGRRAINFSEWDRIQIKAVLAADDVQTTRMPPPVSSVLLPGTELSAEERAAMFSGLEATFGGSVNIVISMTEYQFSPTPLRIEGGEGQRVVFSLQNNGTETHSFSAPALGLQSREIAPGDRQTLQFISTQEFSVRYVCTVPGHEDKGMVGYLTIE